MQFGNHIPSEVREKGAQAPAAVFTRGLSLGRGTQWKFAFDNGFGASVINDGYGSESGLYELAVLDDGGITYDTPLTDDVLGHLTEDQVAEALDKISALTRESVLEAQIAAEQEKRDQRIAELRAEIDRLESEATR